MNPASVSYSGDSGNGKPCSLCRSLMLRDASIMSVPGVPQSSRTCAAVHGSILDRLGQMVGPDRLLSLKVGDGSRHLEDPIVGPRREAQPLDRGFEEPLPFRPDGAMPADLLGAHLGVAEGLGPFEPFVLKGPSLLDPRPNRLGQFPLCLDGKLPIAQ